MVKLQNTPYETMYKYKGVSDNRLPVTYDMAQKRNQRQVELREQHIFFLQDKRNISGTDSETTVENSTKKKKYSPDENILSKLRKQFR